MNRTNSQRAAHLERCNIKLTITTCLDDGELIDVLNQARIEVRYLCSIITDLHERIKQRDVEIGIQQLRLNENQVEIQRLEHMVHRAN
jgi:hypothetical protein